MLNPLQIDPRQRTLILAHPCSGTRYLMRMLRQDFPELEIWFEHPNPADSARVVVHSQVRDLEAYDRVLAWIREPIRVVASYMTLPPPDVRFQHRYPDVELTTDNAKNALRLVTSFYAFVCERVPGKSRHRIEEYGHFVPREPTDTHQPRWSPDQAWEELLALNPLWTWRLETVSHVLGYPR